MNTPAYSLKYPRKTLIRKSMTALGGMLLTMLTEVEIIGKERLPVEGPLILAGNHAAVLEAVMMAVYTPGMVEFIGNGDIPFDPNYAFIANAYGLIPVNRGNLDQKGLQMGLDVLAQDGILGIFPEGGIWNPTQMQAQTGVAWLSYKARAPILPIGFGGVKDSLQEALHLRHPTLTMRVGEIIPPVSLEDTEQSMKAQLEIAAREILNAIKALVPKEDLEDYHNRVDETYHLEIEVYSETRKVDLPPAHQVTHSSAYARFLYNPTLLDVLNRNLHLPLKPLKDIHPCSKLRPVLTAWESILNYLEINPGFFTYRFGVQEGLEVKKALHELRQLGEWALSSGYRLKISPVRCFKNARTGAQVIERGGCFPKRL